MGIEPTCPYLPDAGFKYGSNLYIPRKEGGLGSACPAYVDNSLLPNPQSRPLATHLGFDTPGTDNSFTLPYRALALSVSKFQIGGPGETRTLTPVRALGSKPSVSTIPPPALEHVLFNLRNDKRRDFGVAVATTPSYDTCLPNRYRYGGIKGLVKDVSCQRP